MRSFNLSEAISMVPDELQDLLVRGAYLEHSIEQLERKRQEQEARLATVRETQPPFLFLRPKDMREAFKGAAAATAADLAALDEALAVNRQLNDYLCKRSEEMLEGWMRTHCAEYRMGLVAEHFTADWQKALNRFTDYVNVFIRALGSARNTAAAGYDRTRGVFSTATYEEIKDAHAAALRVEAEIVATNAIATEHDDLLGKTVFNDPMPRLVHEEYAAVVSRIAGLSAGVAQAEFDRVIAACEDLLTREMDALRQRVEESKRLHTSRTHSYVHDAWNQLHAYAVAHSVETDKLEMVVAQTERDYHDVALAAHRGFRTDSKAKVASELPSQINAHEGANAAQ